MDKLASVEHLLLQENVRTSGESDLVLGAPAEQRVGMRRSGSDSLQARSGSLRRTRANENATSHNITQQTHLLLQKMIVLEQKLKSMEMQLKNEQVQRLNLEAKVVKLEKENELLKSAQSKAHKQLQLFADKFYAETEGISIAGSHPPSPQSSLVELQILSRTDSASSNVSVHSKVSES